MDHTRAAPPPVKGGYPRPMRSPRERPTWAVAAIALAAIALPGCSDEQFRELMLTLAFGVLVMGITAIVISVVNLTVLGGGIATIAINRWGTPTHRSRTWGFVFGGLNVATGITGVLGSLGSLFVFHEAINAAFRDVEGASVGPAPDVVIGSLFGLALSFGWLALGAAGIFVAAQAKAMDLVPRESPSGSA